MDLLNIPPSGKDYCHSLTKYHILLCVVNLSPNHTVENLALKDVSVYHQLWLPPPFSDQYGEQAFNFVTFSDLEKLIQYHTHIPDHLGETRNTQNVF